MVLIKASAEVADSNAGPVGAWNIPIGIRSGFLPGLYTSNSGTFRCWNLMHVRAPLSPGILSLPVGIWLNRDFHYTSGHACMQCSNGFLGDDFLGSR